MLIFLALVVGVIGTTWNLIREQQYNLALRAAHKRARQAIETITSNEAIHQLTHERELRPEQHEFLDKMILYYGESAKEAAATEQERLRQAQAYFRIGLMNQTLERSQESKNAYRRAVALGTQLVADFASQPEFRKQLAGSLANFGTLLFQTDRPPEAEKTYVEAAAIYRKLGAEFRDRPEFRLELATSQQNLGNVFQATNRPKEAEAAHAQALAIVKQLVAEFPNRLMFPKELADIETQKPRADTGGSGLQEGEPGPGDNGK